MTEQTNQGDAVPPAAEPAPTQPAVVVVPPRPGPAEPAGPGGTGGTGGDGAGTASGDAYTVTGTVSSPVSPGVGVLAVGLLDYNVGAEPTTLATTFTANDGSYAFNQVVISSQYLQQHNKTSPDLQVQVSNAAKAVLATSTVQYSTPTTLTVNVVLPSTATGLPSEYEQLTAKLATVYPGNLGGLKEDATQQDITYLANKTGWDARAVALAAIATQLSELTVPAPTPAPVPPRPAGASNAPTGDGQQNEPTTSTVSIAPEFFYALFRAGLPTDADGLFATNSARVQAIWQQAVTDNVIPQTAQSQIPAAVTNFATLAAAHVLTAAPMVGVSTLQEMVAPILTDATQRQQFAQLYAQYQGDWDSLWPAVQKAFPTTAAKLQLAGQLHYLTINNAPLVAALNAKTTVTSTLDLVAAGYYTAEKWTSLIGTTPVPPQISGSTQAEQAANYGKYMAAQVRLAYPTAVLGDQVKTGVMPVTGGAQVAADVAGFLTTNQADFQVGAEPVDAYTTRTKKTITPDVRAQIKRLQRTYQLTPDDTSMAVLLRHNLDSAYALTRYDTAGFVRTFAGKLGGEETATAIHKRAKQIYSATLNIAVSYLKARTGTSIGGAATPFLQTFPPQTTAPGAQAVPPAVVPQTGAPANPGQAAAAQTTAPGDPAPAYATLEDLFGSLDYCCCSDCSSILSPAAYLVDLLNYLDQPAPSAGVDNPQDVLLTRRPDLQYLPLTCANTNTEMPYIDLVNETLEYFVSNGVANGLTGYQGHDTPATITSAELIAAPQYVDDTAYTLLQQAFFPPPLPFNRPLMLLRAHLQNLGRSLPAAMTTLLPGPPGTASYGWTDICIEQLGISRDEYQIFTDFDLTTGKPLSNNLQLGDLYGLPNSTALATLQRPMNLQDFSRRVNVSYVDLTAIVQTQFINPNAPLIPRLQQLNATFTDLQSLHENTLSAAQFAADLPAGLDFDQYRTTSNSSNPANTQTVIDWVNNKYQQIMDLIVIQDLDNDLGDCSGTNFAFQYANPDTTANTLSSTDFLKIIRFIRLWAKLAPLLGDPDDAITIEQTDDIISALYPATDLPPSSGGGPDSPTQDTANQAQLDAGFTALLSRAGFAFEALNLLSLTADQGLAQLLACWAPIQTYGPNSLYQQMFLTPTLLQQDPGPQTATVAPSVGVGDKLSTVINGVGDPTIPAYTVSATDTTPPSGTTATTLTTATNVASHIAAAINSCTASNPAWGGVPLNSRFYATSQQNVITITAGVTVECTTSTGATYGAVTGNPLSWSVTIASTPPAGDVLKSTIDGVEVDYTVAAGDTPAAIATNIVNAVNNTTIPDTYGGPPLNQLVYANTTGPTGATIEFVVMGAGAPFTLNCVDTPANAGTYSAAEPTPTYYTATIPAAATVNRGDVFTTTINGVSLSPPYTAGSGETPGSVAQSIATDINGCVQTDQSTGLALNLEVQATGANDGVITITPIDPSDQVTLQCTSSGTSDTYTAAGPFPESVNAALSGPIPPGAILTTTINGLPLVYQVQPGDTDLEIANNIANLINAPTSVPTLSGGSVPLNSIVIASVKIDPMPPAHTFLTVTANNPTTPFTFGASLVAGGYTAGQGRAPFADDGYGDHLSDPNDPNYPTQTLFAHEAALCAACNITGADFNAITGDTPYGLRYAATTQLTLQNVTKVFRRGWLAQALSMSVLEFLQLRYFTDIHPFAMPDPGDGPAAMIVFIELVQALNNAGIIPAQALYLMWNQDNAGTYTPPPGVITGLAAALVADFAAVDAEFVMPPGGDPDGNIATNLMTLVYGAAATDTFFGLLNNTFTSSVPYSVPPGQNSLPAPVLTAVTGPSGQQQLSYNNLTKQLTFSGVLTPTSMGAIDNAIVNTTDSTTVNPGANATFTPASMNNISVGTILVIDTTGPNQETVTVTAVTPPAAPTTFTADTANTHTGPFPISNDPNLVGGIAALAAANQQVVNQFFAAYPELQPLYWNYVGSTQPVQDKRTALLQQLLPVLKTARKTQQALATASSTAGVDPSFATALLQDPTVLHTDTFIANVLAPSAPTLDADADPTAPAVNDLTNIENQGLTTQFYLDNNPSGTPDQTVNPQPPPSSGAPPPPLSYNQTATVAGGITAGDTLTTTIDGVEVSPTYAATSTDTAATIAASVAATINACTKSVVTPVGSLPMNQVVTATSSGSVITIAGSDPSGANGVFTLATNVTSSSANPTEKYTKGTQLPTTSGSSGIAAVWSGYLTVPQNGSYDINIATDEGAQITLEINDTVIPGAMSGTLWSNTAQIALTSGSPIPLTLTATSIKTTFSVSWTSQGLGWQPIPTTNLYPLDYVTQMGNTYTRFLKAASLASALSLTANEITYLGTATGYAVNTTCDKLIDPGAAGAAVTITPASMTNITQGSVLLIDSGPNMETIKVATITATTFTAVVTKTHDGTTTPFSVISPSNPVISQGWLNFLAPQGNPDQSTAASLTAVLTALLDYARIKQALSPSDERLLAVLTDPTADVPGLPGQNGLQSLTGWSLPSLNALLTHFFPGAGQFPTSASTGSVLSPVENFRRIYDAYTLVTASGLSAANLISAITNTPTPTTVAALQSALRAQYAESDWLTVIGPINDTARIQQRDALVAYIVQQLGDAYENKLTLLPTTAIDTTPGCAGLVFNPTSALEAGMPVAAGSAIAPGTTITQVWTGPINGNTLTLVSLSSPAVATIKQGTLIAFAPVNAIPITDSDTLYDLLFVDTQTQPPVVTSRIRLAMSIVQLFIERIIRNLEPQCAAADINTQQWSWMKSYRMWQANREVFLHPENYADPQLRDDQSPFFQQMMTNLQQGDITDDAATSGYLTYLTSLEEVAKLEPCGMYYLPGSPDTDETTYVVARTAGGRRKYYFRELTGGSWTPWTEVNIDCEDNPLTPVVWNRRLFLFWLKAIKQGNPPSPPTIAPSSDTGDTLADVSLGDLQTTITNSANSASGVRASAALCWTEYYNGAWQPTKTSDVNLPTTIGTGISFAPSGSYSFDVQRALLRLVPFQFPAPNTFAAICESMPMSVVGTGGTVSINNVSPTVFPADSIVIAITPWSGGIGDAFPDWDIFGGFMLHNTHSLPVRIEDIVDPGTNAQLAYLLSVLLEWQAYGMLPGEGYDQFAYFRTFPTAQLYTGQSTPETDFTIWYGTTAVGGNITENVLSYSWMPRWVDTQPLLPGTWDAPFLYEDRRAQFYVTTTISGGSSGATSFGMPSAAIRSNTTVNIPRLVLAKQSAASAPAAVNGVAADPATLWRDLAASPNISTGLSMRAPVTYQGRVILPAGNTARLLPAKSPSENS